MRKTTKLISLLTAFALFLGLVFGQAISAKAAFYEDQKVWIEGYCTLNILVLKETLHADGYSTTTSGDVTDLWLTTDVCIFPNNVENERTWTAYHPNGEYAKGSFNNKIGIPSPWGAVGVSTSTEYLSILF